MKFNVNDIVYSTSYGSTDPKRWIVLETTEKWFTIGPYIDSRGAIIHDTRTIGKYQWDIKNDYDHLILDINRTFARKVKVGDKVIRINMDYDAMKIGDIGTIIKICNDGHVRLREFALNHSLKNLELMKIFEF